MRQAKTGWKWVIALFSLLLTVLIWRQGLQESFDRPSVAPKISLMQTEMAVSASSSIPETIQDVFLGSEPQEKLYQALKKIPSKQLEDRQRLLLAVLEESKDEQKLILKKNFKDKNLSSTSRAWTKKYKKNANKKERSKSKRDLRGAEE